MKFMCVISGCIWTGGVLTHVGSEVLKLQCCSRCGSFRYVPEQEQTH